MSRAYATLEANPKPVYFENEQDIRQFYPPIKKSHAATIRSHNQAIANRAMHDQYESDLQERMKKAAHQAHIRAWHENSVKTMARRQEIRQRQLKVAEIEAANTVLTETRRFKLKQLLDDEYNMYIEELASKGLAIYH